MTECLVVPRQDLVHVLFQIREELGILDHPVLDDFTPPCQILTVWQRRQARVYR